MLLKDLDAFLEENQKVDYELFEEQKQVQCLWLENRASYINEYGIKIRAGYTETWDEECEEYAIDFNFYMFFDAINNKHLYEEAGSSLEVCLYNYLRGVRKITLGIDEIENLECEVHL